MVVVGAKASVCPSVCWGHRAQVELCPQVPVSELGAAGSTPLSRKNVLVAVSSWQRKVKFSPEVTSDLGSTESVGVSYSPVREGG